MYGRADRCPKQAPRRISAGRRYREYPNGSLLVGELDWLCDLIDEG